MDIRINTLEIQHFKGIKSRAVDFGGVDAIIAGRNRAGKSTVRDAWLWLLFGKDGAGRKDFAIKPQDKDGNELHNLETIVSAEIVIDGVVHTLRRAWVEKWTKKRGGDEREFEGHTAKYYIDDVPKKKAEYEGWIAALLDENIFRIVTNPAYFNEIIPWQDRRKALFALVKTISDEEIIEHMPEFAAIDLKGRSVDDLKKIAKEAVAKLEKDKAQIGPRIDELSLQRPAQHDFAALSKEEEALLADMVRIDNELADAMNTTNKYTDLQREFAQIMAKMDERKRALHETANAGRADTLRKTADLEHRIALWDNDLFDLANKKDRYAAERETLTAEANELRAKWAKVNAEQSSDTACPTCGREWPEEKRVELAEAFEQNKRSRLESITAQGKAKMEKAKAAEESIARLEKEIAERNADIEKAHAEADALREGMVEPTEVDPMTDKEYAALAKAADKARGALATPAENTTADLLRKKGETQAKLDEINKKLGSRDDADDIKARTKELRAEQKRLAQLIADQEKLLDLYDRFTAYKCDLQEAPINALFPPRIRWRLFDRQINGGVSECCECLVGGVPYPDVNNADRINAGIDIARVLGGQYGVTAPMFIDNAEAVNDLHNAGGQMIALYVSNDPEMVVTTAKKEEVA